MEPISLLKDKRIILGVTGSIAVYKAIDLASRLTQAGALVDVIMTESAQQFVTPLAFQAVTGRAVYTDMWASGGTGLPTHIAHVGLGEGADLLVIAPITAQTMAKLANGLADNLLSVTALAARCPLVMAPAMDGGMYSHPATQANITTLIERGVMLIEPDEGRFASGLAGKGRLPDTSTLIGHIRRALGREGGLAGKKLVVSAGGTREPLDPVRYLTNRSSGKQGYAIVQAALDAGAEVVLISSADLPIPIGAQMVKIDTAQSLLDAVIEHSTQADVLIMTAAVADYRPASAAQQKIKKSDDDLTLQLARNSDILLAVKEMANRPQVVVGFAAESENLLENAQDKLVRKGLDLLVANDISATDAGFASDYNRVTLLGRDGSQQSIDRSSKMAIAEVIIEHVVVLLS